MIVEEGSAAAIDSVSALSCAAAAVLLRDQIDELVTGAGVVTGVRERRRGSAPSEAPTATKRPAPVVAPALSAEARQFQQGIAHAGA